MATIDKETALSLIEKVKKQKRPRIYCITCYRNVMFNIESYAVCYSNEEYARHFKSPAVGSVKILWSSEKFKKDHPNGVYLYDKEWLKSDEGKKFIAKIKELGKEF